MKVSQYFYLGYDMDTESSVSWLLLGLSPFFWHPRATLPYGTLELPVKYLSIDPSLYGPDAGLSSTAMPSFTEPHH